MTAQTRPAPPQSASSSFFPLIDTHCHLDFPDYQDDYAAMLARAEEAGVVEIITVGIDLPTSRQAVALAQTAVGEESNLKVHATVGVHPHHVNELVEGDYRRLRALASSPPVVAYGEIGLDYAKEYSPAPLQRRHFAAQVQLARELGLPLIIHDREAHADTLAILNEAGPLPAGGVMHCFSGDAALAEQVIDMGFYISITGVITFKTAATLREAVSRVPLDRLLLETDGPFLAPVPHRGKRNEPAFLTFIAAKIAELKGCSLAELTAATTANARRLFNLT
ncbi:TatD family hydrolase [Desulfurivibrio sp. D14AmB]|uniref:TatD family hydrolase n=1 Tax=Desulfurivibrio sp. D14AmB TaxID=3374370 RepID=UPI00376ED555